MIVQKCSLSLAIANPEGLIAGGCLIKIDDSVRFSKVVSVWQSLQLFPWILRAFTLYGLLKFLTSTILNFPRQILPYARRLLLIVAVHLSVGSALYIAQEDVYESQIGHTSSRMNHFFDSTMYCVLLKAVFIHRLICLLH